MTPPLTSTPAANKFEQSQTANAFLIDASSRELLLSTYRLFRLRTLRKRIVSRMTDRVALKLDRNKELVLVAVAWMAVAAPLAFGQGNAAAKTQAPAGQVVTAIPQWQTAAGGKMTFEVASIRP